MWPRPLYCQVNHWSNYCNEQHDTLMISLLLHEHLLPLIERVHSSRQNGPVSSQAGVSVTIQTCGRQYLVRIPANTPAIPTGDMCCSHFRLNTRIITVLHDDCFLPDPFQFILPKKTKHLGLSPRANYTDRATAACRRIDCQLLRIECATWSAWRIPTAVFSVF
jgi:hypothetical protein